LYIATTVQIWTDPVERNFTDFNFTNVKPWILGTYLYGKKTAAGQRKETDAFKILRRNKGSGMLIGKKDEVQKKISELSTKPVTIGCQKPLQKPYLLAKNFTQNALSHITYCYI